MIKIVRKLLILIVILATILVATLYVVGKTDKTISRVDIVSNDGLSYISKQSLIDNLTKDGSKEWFDVNVNEIERSLYNIKGVDYALVKKIWPSTIVIYLFDHKPVAYWNNSEILLDNMELIKPEVFSYNGDLPHIQSDNPDSRDYIFDTYQNLEKIAASKDESILEIIYKGNQFQLVLSGGMNVMLGSSKLSAKLKEFFANFKKVRNHESVKYFDMRYTDGFTVKYN
jgi:cell division protein FtsQ